MQDYVDKGDTSPQAQAQLQAQIEDVVVVGHRDPDDPNSKLASLAVNISQSTGSAFNNAPPLVQKAIGYGSVALGGVSGVVTYSLGELRRAVILLPPAALPAGGHFVRHAIRRSNDLASPTQPASSPDFPTQSGAWLSGPSPDMTAQLLALRSHWAGIRSAGVHLCAPPPPRRHIRP